MCFNYKISLLTFLLGSFFSYLLINYGNVKYYLNNKASGTFLFFISGIQFMNFLFWIDINNIYGINHLITLIGPIYNAGQPIILYIIKLIYYKPKKINIIIALLNFLYVLYMCNMYINFISNGKLVTTKKNGNLEWPWIKYSNPYFYIILLAINIFYLSDFKYSLLNFLITYLFLYLNVSFFKYNISEISCVFTSFVPLFIFIITKFLF